MSQTFEECIIPHCSKGDVAKERWQMVPGGSVCEGKESRTVENEHQQECRVLPGRYPQSHGTSHEEHHLVEHRKYVIGPSPAIHAGEMEFDDFRYGIPH